MLEIHAAPFVIIAQARSGSTMLRKALHAHDHLCCHGEIFLKRKVQGHGFHIPGLDWTEAPQLLAERRDGDFRDFIQTCVFPPRPNWSAIGFKILDEQFDSVENRERLRDLITTNPHTRLIYLYRENALDRYISRLIRRGKLDSSGPQALSVEEFKAFEAGSVERMNRILDWFPSHSKVVLSYEALAARIENSVSFLYGFLGVDLGPVIIEETKSAPRDVSRLIENYQQLTSVQLPEFDFDTEDFPSQELQELDTLSPAHGAQAAYDLGCAFSRR